MSVHWTETAFTPSGDLVYRVEGEQVNIVAVVHGARCMPRTPPK